MVYSRIIFSVYFLLVSFWLHSKELEVFIANKTFYAPEVGAYVETDILIPGSCVHFVKKENGKFQGTVEISLIVNKNLEVAAFEKYRLNTVEVDDTAKLDFSIIDKKRFVLPNGVYSLEASFKDVNSTKEATKITEPFIVDIIAEQVQVSDISLVDYYHKSVEQNIYTKSGLYMAPYVVDFYPEKIGTLNFYAEIYNTDKYPDRKFLVVSSVKSSTGSQVMGDLVNYRKIEGKPVHVLFSSFNISTLPSGNYDLTVEVKDQDNNLVSIKKQFFFRSNPIEVVQPGDYSKVYVENTFVQEFSHANIIYQLRSLAPISTADENQAIRSLLKAKDEASMKRFFLNFWLTRNPADPQSAWYAYSKEVNKVNQNYYTNLEYGFETDRGRVYLQFGAPNEMLQSPREPGADPYEIWTYFKLPTGETNVKFVFHNPDLVSNNYLLIHSTAPGEIKNEQWQRVVHESFIGGNSPVEHGEKVRDHFGTKASELYDE